jgi:demethylmenaquinone methyltransferase/2-methoxy-6-polyprenyl-1,4-benzoquinol methylase
MRMDKVDFGYRQVSPEEKTHRVGQVFDSVAGRYDLMNDLMSFGIHRLWKRFTLNLTGVRAGDRVLDLASGTGDLAARLAERVGPHGRVIASDINFTMLAEGRRRLTDRGLVSPLDYVIADAETLPFADGCFDCVTIGFGLRNVSRKDCALEEMLRVLKPGGRALVLEFSHPVVPGLKPFYDLYSFGMLPLMGRVVAGDAASYRYLAESIRMHPGQETLRELMCQAGFERCEYFNLSGGIVAVHRGYRF